MKILETEFTEDGFTLKQIVRQGDLAIYHKHKPKYSFKEECEVIRIRQKPEVVVFGNSVPAREAYPSPSEWGRYGFTCIGFKRAYDKLTELAETASKRKNLETLVSKPCPDIIPESKQDDDAALELNPGTLGVLTQTVIP